MNAHARQTTVKHPLHDMQEALNLTDAELAFLLDTHPRTVARWVQGPAPEHHVPYQQLKNIVELARRSLKGKALAEWFHERNRALGGSVPLRLMADPRGYELVYNLLYQAAYGLAA